MTTSNRGNDILIRLAGRNNGEPATVETLADWLESGECPADAIRDAAWSTLELAEKTGEWEEPEPAKDTAASATITLDPERDQAVVDYRRYRLSPSGTSIPPSRPSRTQSNAPTCPCCGTGCPRTRGPETAFPWKYCISLG